VSEWLIELLYVEDHATHAQHKFVEEFLVEQAFIDSQRRSRRCLGEYSHNWSLFVHYHL